MDAADAKHGLFHTQFGHLLANNTRFGNYAAKIHRIGIQRFDFGQDGAKIGGAHREAFTRNDFAARFFEERTKPLQVSRAVVAGVGNNGNFFGAQFFGRPVGQWFVFIH